MPVQLDNLSPFIIPPLLSLLIQIFLITVALVRGRGSEISLLLAVVSVWWSLLLPVFIAHHIITDETLLLLIERRVHSVYVFIMPVTVHLVHRSFRLWRLPFMSVLVAISCVFSYFTSTDYYFNGFHKFEWGYIAHGGVAFDLFGLYAAACTLYVFVVIYRQMQKKMGPLTRIKARYISYSFLIASFFSLLNVPAIKGYDVYPLGNLIFIPLSVLSYGVLRHRLIDARFLMKVTVPRIVFSLLILAPNFALIFWMKPYLSRIDPILLCAGAVLWFLANYYYFQFVQPLIDRLFQRRRRVLVRKEIAKKRGTYKISHIAGIDLQEVEGKLTEVMESERVYCDEDLTLSRLADMVDLSSHQLSEYLNRHLNQSFYAYINRYRIEEAKGLLKDHERSVLDVALGVGYNSKSAFYRAFKEATGLTPSRYRELDREWKGIKPAQSDT